MRVELQDGAVVLRLSRLVLALSIGGGLAIAFRPFRDGAATPVMTRDANVVTRGDRAMGVSRVGRSSGDQSTITRDPFVATDDAVTERQPQRPSTSPTQAAGNGSPVSPSTPDVPELIGTVVDPLGGSFAICALGSNQPKAVRIGGHIGSYRVDSIAPGIAVLVDSTRRTLTLRLRLRSQR